jgi:hypothetical protein
MHAELAVRGGEEFEFSRLEREVLARACSLADREAELAEIVRRDGMLVSGSRGQVALHPAAQELRQIERLVVDLLARVDLDEAGEAQTPRQRRASTAARARWDRERDELARKREAAGVA